MTRKWRIAFRAAVFATLLYLLWRNVNLSWLGDLEQARAFFASLGPWAPVVFLGLFVASAFLHTPEIVIVGLGVILFGEYLGFLYGWAGAVLGSTLCFLTVRYALRDAFRVALIERFAWLRRLDELFEAHGFLTILALRVFFFMAPPLNWAVSATRVRFVHYLAGSAIGVVPGLLLTVVFAGSAARATSAGAMLEPRVIVPGLLLGLLLVGAAWLGRRLIRSGDLGAKPPSVGTRAG